MSKSNVSLNFGVIINPPSVNDCFQNDSNCPYPGFGIEMARLLCISKNWNCTFNLADTDNYGYLENGTWHGLIGFIKNGQFDLSVPRLAPTADRFTAVDFSGAFFYDNMLFVTRYPLNSASTDRLDLFGAFKWPVWLCVAALALLAAHMMEDTIIIRRRKALIVTMFEKFASNLFSHSRHICIVLMSLAALILLRSYTGFIFSKRVPLFGHPPFIDLESFVVCMEKGNCKLITTTPTVGFMKETLKGDDSPVMKRLKTVITEKPVEAIWPPKRMLSTIINDTSQFITGFIWSTDFYYAAGQNHCQFYKLGHIFRLAARTIPMKKKFALENNLDIFADKLFESGISNKILNGYYQANACPNEREHLQPASLSFLMAIFTFYCIGTVISMLMFLVELGLNGRRSAWCVDFGLLVW